MSAHPIRTADPQRPVSALAGGERPPVSAPALTTSGERLAPWPALITERYAPDSAHNTTDDNAVRRALQAAARSRRW